jgi:hypothetical protein
MAGSVQQARSWQLVQLLGLLPLALELIAAELKEQVQLLGGVIGSGLAP